MDETIRLLEKLWADLRHIETERHWFLGAYAVIAVGVVALADDLAGLKAYRGFPFVVATGASLLGLIHTVRAAWALLLVQDKINAVVQEVKNVAPPKVPDVIDHWRFGQGTPKGFGDSAKWLLSVLLPINTDGHYKHHMLTFVVHLWVYERLRFTFGNIHVFVYVLGTVVFLLLAIYPDYIIPPPTKP